MHLDVAATFVSPRHQLTPFDIRKHESMPTERYPHHL